MRTRLLFAFAPFLAAFASLTFAPTLAAQAVTVGPAGSGAMFEVIQEGIDAAPAGGVVLVAPGSYSAAETLRIDKALTVLGAGSASTTYLAEPAGASAGFRLPLRIEGLAAGEQATVAGIGLVSRIQASHAPVNHARIAFEVDNCAGPVLLADLTLLGFFGSSAGQFDQAALVRDSAMVVLDRCRIDATTHFDRGPPALAVVRSLVHVNDCWLLGSRARNVASDVRDGAPSILVTDSTLRVARSELIGGAGIQFGFPAPNPPGTAGGAAIEAIRSVVHLRGGPGNELRGGLGGGGGGVGGPAVSVDTFSLLSSTPDVVAIPGLDGDLQSTTPPIQGNGLQAPLAFPLPTVALASTFVSPGGAAAVELRGEPLAVCLPLIALRASAGFQLAGVFGLFVVDPMGIFTLPAVVLDASGVGAASVSVPPVPALAGTIGHAQSLSFAPSGWIAVSGPTMFAVR